MTEETPTIEETLPNWKPKVLVIGGLIGAVLGLGAAYLLIQSADRQNRPLALSTGEGIKLGLLALGTLRQVAQLSGDKD